MVLPELRDVAHGTGKRVILLAYVTVSRSKNAIAALRYGEHEKSAIVSGVCCPDDTETAIKLFKADRIMWNKDSGVEAHIIVQSFDGRECSPEEANLIGKALARKVAPGHRAMVYTHQESDGGNIHNHVIISAVNYENGKKLDDHGFLWKCRENSNTITDKMGLSDIRERSAKLRYTQAEKALVSKGVQPWKDEIREVIDYAKTHCKNTGEFKDFLQSKGIRITERGSRKEGGKGGTAWTYHHPAGGSVRGRTLGGAYTRAAVVRSLSMERGGTSALARGLSSATQAKRLTEILSDARRLMAKPAAGASTGALQARIGKLQKILDSLNTMSRGADGIVDLGAAMGASAERAKIEAAIGTLKDCLAGAEAKAAAAAVLDIGGR